MGRKAFIEILEARVENLNERIEDFPRKDGTLHSNERLLDKWEDEREALQWALRKLKAEEIGIGDRVKLYVYQDEPSEQPEQGEVIGHATGGWLIRPFTGTYSGTKTGLWYPKDQVWLVDE